MPITKALCTTTVSASFLALPATPAVARPMDSLGAHVSVWAQHNGFSGSHNPSTHRTHPAGGHQCHH